MAVPERHGWSVVQVFEDAGISGAKGRKERPALDALLKAVARREIDMVAGWSVERLGRPLTDRLDLNLNARGIGGRVRPQLGRPGEITTSINIYAIPFLGDFEPSGCHL